MDKDTCECLRRTKSGVSWLQNRAVSATVQTDKDDSQFADSGGLVR